MGVLTDETSSEHKPIEYAENNPNVNDIKRAFEIVEMCRVSGEIADGEVELVVIHLQIATSCFKSENKKNNKASMGRQTELHSHLFRTESDHRKRWVQQV